MANLSVSRRVARPLEGTKKEKLVRRIQENELGKVPISADEVFQTQTFRECLFCVLLQDLTVRGL